ncbi:MAG: hypothetical protein RMI91_09880 [Gemmatales bacterium]|nr:hypothetical protein [Gemmatales bacterium]MDW7994949.1 hypothetical protein [Gemmatales bacterium]
MANQAPECWEGIPMLNLRRVTLPQANVTVLAAAYSTAERAAEHIANHVLRSPEMDKWLVIEPRLSPYLGSDGVVARWNQIARQRPVSSELQPLYDIYCECVDLEMRDARQLGWYKTETCRGPRSKEWSVWASARVASWASLKVVITDNG